MTAPVPCPRCGAPIVPLDELARLAVEAAEAHRTMRLALPAKLTTAVRVLGASLPCHADTCSTAEREERFR